ncbi:MAG: TonB-dependent receptor [Gammaproteobacteria bacterium]
MPLIVRKIIPSMSLAFFFVFDCDSTEIRKEDSVTADSETAKLAPMRVVYQKDLLQQLPTSLPNSRILPEEDPLTQSSVIGLLRKSVGVSANGQGGLLQNYSIRGISRQRVTTMISGMRIVTDRRAGTAATFLDPLLIDELDIYRGAGSSFFGSGALGGAVNISPKKFRSLQFASGYRSNFDENFQMIGWGNQSTSLGFSRRSAQNAESPDKENLNTHFTQYSAVFSQNFRLPNHVIDFLLIPTRGNKIGKSNTDYPIRTTDYPREEHLLVSLNIEPHHSAWKAMFSMHINELETQVVRQQENKNLVENTAYDFSGQLFQNWSFKNLKGQSGIDFFGRRAVESTEKKIDLIAGTNTNQTTLDDGEENEIALYNSINTKLGPGEIQTGIRYTYFIQSERSSKSQDKHLFSGHLGYIAPLFGDFELSGLFSTGYRMPSLTERFFSGTTGRGSVIGNPQLIPEYAYNFDLGLSYHGSAHQFSLHSFYNLIDDYIEQIELNDNVSTFQNVASGQIYGLELEGVYEITKNILFRYNGSWMRGEDDNGKTLNDIPAHQTFFELIYAPENWKFGIELHSLSQKNQIGPREKKTPSAHLLSASIGYAFNHHLSISFSGENLVNENYFYSADSKAAPEPGRYFGIRLEASM